MALPNWWGKDRERVNRLSRAQEKDRAKEIDGKVQAGSGSSWRAKEDVKSADFMEQLKFTEKDSITIQVGSWLHLRSSALELGLEPRYVIEFKTQGIRLIITEG